MPNAASLTLDSRFLGLFVGHSGDGKTVAAASFPGPIDDMDFDGRIRGILGAPWITEEKRKQINYDYYPPRDINVIERIDKKLEAYEAMRKAGQPLPQTLLLDSLTSECVLLTQQSLALTHNVGGKDSKQVGKFIGKTPMLGPEDYGFEATKTYDIFSHLRSIPIPNVIVTAHLVDRYGKSDPSNPYSESTVVGEKLSVRDKIGENIQIYFDHVFKFSRREIGGEVKFFVQFKGDLARTAFSNLPNGQVDITGKDFYKTMMELAKV